ncbi:extradiol ring-cleavage dioxygenase (plasmid) [Rhodococcoides fascians A21d2]|uniref:VOC family protein n=1 Tax=Rhodococcoides fascians TaxID=1828 RepID=UPI00068A9F3E|nr:VOC family protein [Rhodococcus fascians]QII03674.1 extradiol ring-cleavage dioxygenase [Rhodococcus fascians A21d2]
MSTTTLDRNSVDPSVFGHVQLGYMVIETQKFAEWRRFGAEAIGMHLDEMDTGRIRFRLDDHQCRFLLQYGPAEDVTALGWQITDHDTFDRIVARVVERGVPIEEGTAEEAALRGVERLLRFPGPKGLVQEIFTRALTSTEPLIMKNSAYVTGDSGMGHVAITSVEPHKLRGYYNTVFDARLTDYIDETISGVSLKIRFLRVNERHHSIAVAGIRGLKINPIRTRVQHLNIQVAQLDDMIASFERVKQLGFGMALSVGQHTNDRELSYYAVTPSGFEWEVGWNPFTIDENTWEPSTHKGISIWGHSVAGQTVIQKLEQFKLGALSLGKSEITVPELSGNGIADYSERTTQGDL